MAHRPYPNADRARAQLDRGRRPEPPTEFQLRLAEQAQAAMEYAGRVVGPFVQNMREGLARAADPEWERAMDGPMWQPGLKVAAPPVDEYRLSTRPGVVGGTS
ncbi:hypothetical protein ABT099_25925 [Streptomyces prasinus]|uniref:hypothetical protein n=1 Tax=Streptomyces prasinus TaxID=67345 RepID=UPI00332ECD09